MKHFYRPGISLLLLLFFYCQAAMTQMISLPKECKFSFGDNSAWAGPGFNDNSWSIQQLGKSYTKDSSYAWYRIKIVIPSSMKTPAGKGIKLLLGKIDDVDQTFFNGNLIGATGSFPPAYVTQWEKQRIYTIPEAEVKWDEENLIAVRIYNLIGGMGMWEGPYSITPLGWVDEVLVKQTVTETAGNGFITTISFTNKTDNPFNGTVKYWITDKAGRKMLFTESKPAHLAAKTGSVEEVRFSAFRLSGERVFHIGYQINDNKSQLFLKNEELYIVSGGLSVPARKEVKPVIKDKVLNAFTSVNFSNELYRGYLNTRFTRNLEQRLLKVDEFGLIGSYLHRPGIHPWAGEHIGKYLETASNVWKLTHSPALKKQMDRLMFSLINTQLENGYLGTYTPDEYWTSWDVWSHKYNLHGLLSYYSATGYSPALDACRKIGDLMCSTFGKGKGQKDIILAGTHMGMAATSVLDAMVELYKYTGEKKYLDFCYYILDAWEQENGPKVISTMLATGKVKKVGNAKAYEMLSNYVGLIKLYRVTGEKRFLKATEMAWQDVVNTQLYITGTASSHEYFQEDDYLPATSKDNMGEGCVTTTWVQLNQNLFEITGDIKYINQLERTVYNHLLAAENPQTGCVSYYTPLIDKKPFTCFITCCQSSVPRGIALVPNFTFGKLNNAPAVLIYEPASYTYNINSAAGKQAKVVFKLEGDFPETGQFTLTVNSTDKNIFPVALRVPEWCSNFIAKAGGKIYKGIPDQFVTITQQWKPGEKILISFDMPVKLIGGGKSYPGQLAVQRGPQLLALDKSLNTEVVNSLVGSSNGELRIDTTGMLSVPGILPAGWIGKQAYSLQITDRKEKIVLVPFAEASQTEGDMRVWLPLALKK